MKTRAAVLWEAPGKWRVQEVELDEPKTGEVLVEMVATGLCHSDDHISHGDIPPEHLPVVAGHEGSGIVRKVGPGVTTLEVGDHVITSFIPGCGKCRWCAMGMQNLCDLGAKIMVGDQLDGTFRMHADGHDIATSALLGTFAEWQVYDELSLVKIDKDIPLEIACLVACGVQTGFGSAAYAGNVQPGDVVLVFGVGGVGMNAVQGARESGASHIIAIDPVANKQAWALDFGATESYGSLDEARDRLAALTNGQGADVVVLTASIVDNALVGGPLRRPQGRHARRHGRELGERGRADPRLQRELPRDDADPHPGCPVRHEVAPRGHAEPAEHVPRRQPQARRAHHAHLHPR
ncbi:alcohol dehydrogenase catalytic domain-containing protein [Agromyces archimandritae]|uniref:Alcohol dehydrogenase catalytic domain-containing protein n=1 Tax=Agromyces archimandritae TaxID=2781962 RepID=A0A975FM96_9MICO|nr:alcohol dehydrogenase catalytic domain-containing protein [Agromyces archimandritae]QTX04322.1 alcohol dehydrogenase catalytic domain-containing protein [Agromyces archimandritae]